MAEADDIDPHKTLKRRPRLRDLDIGMIWGMIWGMIRPAGSGHAAPSLAAAATL